MPDAAGALVADGTEALCVCALGAPTRVTAGGLAAAPGWRGPFDLPRRNEETQTSPSDGDTVFGAYRRAPDLRPHLLVVADGTGGAELGEDGRPATPAPSGLAGRAAGAAQRLPGRRRRGVAP
jgi:hypothetical protein